MRTAIRRQKFNITPYLKRRNQCDRGWGLPLVGRCYFEIRILSACPAFPRCTFWSAGICEIVSLYSERAVRKLRSVRRRSGLTMICIQSAELMAGCWAQPAGSGTSILDQPLVFEELMDLSVLETEENQTGTQLSASFSVDRPKLWSPDREAALFQLIATLKNPEGKIVESVCQRIGFRKFQIETLDGVQRLLNGNHSCWKASTVMKPIRTRPGSIERRRRKGFSQIWWWKLQHQCLPHFHYPNHPLTYDIADERGLIVVDRQFQHWIHRRETGVPGNKSLYNGLMVWLTVSMVERDKNHASVLFWSLGNESYQEYEMNETIRSTTTSMWILQGPEIHCEFMAITGLARPAKRRWLTSPAVNTGRWISSRITPEKQERFFQSEYIPRDGQRRHNGGILWSIRTYPHLQVALSSLSIRHPDRRSSDRPVFLRLRQRLANTAERRGFLRQWLVNGPYTERRAAGSQESPAGRAVFSMRLPLLVSARSSMIFGNESRWISSWNWTFIKKNGQLFIRCCWVMQKRKLPRLTQTLKVWKPSKMGWKRWNCIGSFCQNINRSALRMLTAVGRVIV